MRCLLRFFVLCSILTWLGGCEARGVMEAPTRALWVTRWDYRTQDDVERIVEEAHAAGFNELLFQVRGNATCFFRSSHEPWAEQFGFEDPGFDPLAVALAAAHQRGMALHAWVNVVPAWWGSEPPGSPAHVLNQHPEWLWYDAEGARQPLEERFYVSLNPCLPEVRDYLAAVFEELLERYAVDGLHLDYIRFPNELTERAGTDYPRDARTLALFRDSSGGTPEEAPEAWDAWRTAQLTQLVRELRDVQRRVRPAALLSAAVGSEPAAAARHFQDWPSWIEEGLVDALLPMNYAGEGPRFAERCAAWEARRDSVRVVMGVHAESAPPELVRERLGDVSARFGGYAIFGYLSLWDSANDVIDVQTPERSAERARLRAALLPLER
jgi:uncharacterized lipoprotein YddW (UPF0748 family)